MLPCAPIAMFQIAVVFGVGSLLFSFDRGEVPLAFVLLVVAIGLAVGAL